MSWSEKSLDELGFVSRGRSRNRPRDAAHLYGGPYPFVQTGDVKHSGLYLTEYSQTYSEEGLAQSKLWPVGTLCITIAANIADTSILGIEACFPDSVIGFIPTQGKADARFIKYLFDAVLKLRYRQYTQGAAQDNLSQGKLLALKFLVPDDVKEQKRIADFIASYDELIENNRRRMQLLEESARLLYQEWFVHLRFPGHELVKVIDGVPEGWEKSELEGHIHFSNGKAIKKSEEGIIPIYGANGIIGYENKSLFDSGVIVGRVGAYCGSTMLALTKFWGSDNTIIAQPAGARFGLYFLYFMLKKLDLNRFAGGAAQPLLTQTNLKKLEVLFPNQQLCFEFDKFSKDIFSQVNTLEERNKKLVQARDLLLPKLMNGELTV